VFEIGFWELLVIALIALLVLGPERLPVVMRTIAKSISRVKKMIADITTGQPS